MILLIYSMSGFAHQEASHATSIHQQHSTNISSSIDEVDATHSRFRVASPLSASTYHNTILNSQRPSNNLLTGGI